MNSKVLGNGLYKFQPNDYNSAMILDIRIISDLDKEKVLSKFEEFIESHHISLLDEMDEIFKKYL